MELHTVDNVLSSWLPWQPLDGSWLGDRTPKQPGLYRIRRIGCDELDYIGQTGLNLKGHLDMLRGVYAVAMPYRGPHTAGLALWALRHGTGCDFEASVLPFEGDGQLLKGLETLVIALHRQQYGHSPNNARLVTVGKRYRGGLIGATDPDAGSFPSGRDQQPGISPFGPLTGAPVGAHWCGHNWSDWVSVTDAVTQITPKSFGLYRVCRQDEADLIYIGQGMVRERLAAHLAKGLSPTAKQSDWFASPLQCSWVLNADWGEQQRLELENDLIAAYLLTRGCVPPAQFLG